MVTIAVGQGARHRGVAAQREKVLLHASRVGPPADSQACRSSASAGMELEGDAPGPGRALVDQSGVALDQVRAFRQPIEAVLSGALTPAADHGAVGKTGASRHTNAHN